MSRILIVDDQAAMRGVLRDTLTRLGYDVVTVPTGEQALDKALGEHFDLIILDLRIGDESGIAVLKKLRATGADSPMLIYSGAFTPELEAEAHAAGAAEMFDKGAGVAPLVEHIRKLLASGSPSTAGFAKKSKRILIVDDDRAIRGLLTRFLAAKGYDVIEAESGEKAIEAVASKDVSMVLLDIQMPGMDGLETLKKLLEINPRLNVIMATGAHSDERVRTALDLGAYAYVLKPFDFLYLELAVRSRLTSTEGTP